MFFVLSKIIGVFSVPSNLSIFIGLIGITLLPTRFVATGRRLVMASVILVAIIGFLPVGDMLARPLEGRFPAWAPTQGTPTGIIVLGGVINPKISAVRGQVSLDEAAERLTSAVELARQYPDARIVFSGGNGQLIAGIAEANFAVRFFESLGVPRSRITLEARSRNTIENALFSKRLIALKPGDYWLLVTSAMHMPRAVGAFRQVGFPVVPYPVDYQTTGHVWIWSGSAMGGFRTTDAAIHEWIGLLLYWITGRTPELFPGPSRD